MLSNPRPGVQKPDYLEPVLLKAEKKKKSRRRRSPSPIEFHIEGEEEKEKEDEPQSCKIAQLDGGDEEDSDSESSDPDFDPENDDLQDSFNYNQGTPKKKNNDEQQRSLADSEESNDAVDNMPLLQRAGSRGTKRKRTSALKRPASEKRSVYHHSDFDSEDSEEEFIPKPKKRKAPAQKQEPKEDRTNNKKGPKVINTLKSHDDAQATYSPFRNGVFNDKSPQVYDLVVRAVLHLSKGKNATDGVSMMRIKEYISKHFQKQYSHKSFGKKFSESITRGEASGQFIKTSNTKGASGSIVLNHHYNPDDTRGLYSFRELDKEEATIEEVITNRCYDGKPYELPHVPKVYENLREKKAKTSGELYKKMNAMYEMALPMSLAFYASDKRSKQWNREFFDTKVKVITINLKKRNFHSSLNVGGTTKLLRVSLRRFRGGK